MRKFLIVGCGGSGGTTVRLLMDQLQADLRARWGITRLPAAWQFVHVDVPVDPDKGPAPLGSIVDLGGTHVSFSHPTNTYQATSLNVESVLAGRGGGNYAPLVGWAPRDRAVANGVPVVAGAGQYRAIGRMLTLPRLTQLRDALAAAQSRAVAPDAWGDIPMSEQTSDVIIPIVIASMAGGSGASMFLDVSRILGTLGFNASNIGCLVYTADVFGELPESARANVEGNAMAAISEVIGAVSRMAEADDLQLLASMGITSTRSGTPPFGRLVPIGRRIGGSGALFGDGSSLSVYRGIARALCGVMMSEKASAQYLDYTLGNPAPVPMTADRFGWRINDSDLPFGSLGFASLSLGRERYMDYASQRMARLSVDHLVAGHENPSSRMPSPQQLTLLMDNQWTLSLKAMGLPEPGTPTPTWFQSVAFPAGQWQATGREVVAGVITALGSLGPAPAAAWLTAAANRASSMSPQVVERIGGAAYVWAENWAHDLEDSAKKEFTRVAIAFGLPYARDLMDRVRHLCDSVVSDMAAAGQSASGQNPVAVDDRVRQQAAAIGKQEVGAQHSLAQMMAQAIQTGIESRLRLEAAKIGAEVLRSFSVDVLSELATVANDQLRALEVSRSQEAGGAGLAQLHSKRYTDWPGSEETPSARWMHAQNEVLLTTSADFPRQFVADVSASAGAATYTEAVASLRAQVLSGVWETSGAKVREDIVIQRGHWRAPVLSRSAMDGQPTPQAKPSYLLRFATDDVLARSRRRLEAVGDAFHRYASQSIREFLDDPTVAEVDREERRQRFAAEFIRTMALAQPLVGVDGTMVQRLHQTDGVKYIYTFSEIPVGSEHPVAGAIRTRLKGDAALEVSTQTNFDRALSREADVGSVSIFGNYGKYAPLAFISLLEPVKNRWATADQNFQRNLWRWKRTRPLTSALAMHEDEATRMVAGWFIGRLLGLVRQGPGQPQVCTPQGWLTFGAYLESPEVGVGSPLDILPAVLQSHAWAVVRCSGDPDLTDLKPYAALRRLADDSETNQATTLGDYSGTRLLRQAFADQPLTMADPNSRGQATLTGDGLSPVFSIAAASKPIPAAPTATPGASPWDTPGHVATPVTGSVSAGLAVQRHGQLREWLQKNRAYFTSKAFVTTDAMGRYVLDIPSVDALQKAPLHVEVGPLIMKAFDLIDQMADAALAEPETAFDGGQPDPGVDFYV